MRKSLIFIVITLVSLSFIPEEKNEHPLKLSFCEMTYMKDRNQFLLEFRFFADDFSDVLEGFCNNRFQLHTPQAVTGKFLDQCIDYYIETNYRLVVNGKEVPVKHMETKIAMPHVKVGFISDTLPDISTQFDLEVTNEVMMHKFDKQENVLSIRLKELDMDNQNARLDVDERSFKVKLR